MKNCPILASQERKNALYLSVNVFSTKILVGDTGDGTAILRGHPSHAKVKPLAVQREYLSYLKTVSIGPAEPQKSNLRPPALQSTRPTDRANSAAVDKKILNLIF